MKPSRSPFFDSAGDLSLNVGGNWPDRCSLGLVMGLNYSRRDEMDDTRAGHVNQSCPVTAVSGISAHV